MLLHLPVSPLQQITGHPGADKDIQLFVKRDDLLHPDIQGSKARKLAPLLDLVKQHFPDGIITFGGAFSNHLHAVAIAGQLFDIPTVGILRGNYVDVQNPTLKICAAHGMTLIPLSKTLYASRKQDHYQYWREVYPKAYILPEGGNTLDAVLHCTNISAEILAQLPPESLNRPLHICTPAGTGCTAAGVAAGMPASKGSTWIFPVSSDGLELATIRQLLPANLLEVPDIRWVPDYICGGFARWDQNVMDFARHFHQQTGIMADPVYTAKMFYGIYDLLKKGAFQEGSCLVALHTGGQQGWAGFQHRFGPLDFV
ncbi:MAG TPA: 1-aminocyclopropane-1-carboxylate deaminase [Saprospirales bacterium]|nr:1-aminocyclopropane-1-carboxylate deaminase [Saprospirales bacterium]